MAHEQENVLKNEHIDLQEETKKESPHEEEKILTPPNDVSSRALLIKRMPGAEKIYHKFRGEILNN